MTRRSIAKLSSVVADRIAAGEVVLNPAAAVKELVENALDAQATSIDVSIKDGGLKEIEVVDNGTGIVFDQLPLALERHATSKIVSEEDLLTIQSLGFRGEALPSMAAVSRLTIESFPREQSHGGVIEVHAGVMVRHEATGVPKGTRVLVEDLFYAVPARRKFLKTAAYEWQRIHQAVEAARAGAS